VDDDEISLKHSRIAPLNQDRSRGGSADFQVGCIAGFQTCGPCHVRTRRPVSHPADLEIGDTAGWETCATKGASGEDITLRGRFRLRGAGGLLRFRNDSSAKSGGFSFFNRQQPDFVLIL
jgi:hypothetical protein